MQNFTKKLLWFVMGLTLISTGVMGQQKAQSLEIVKGQVIDKEEGTTIIGATVVEVDQDERTLGGVATDVNGNFTLRVRSKQNMLRVSVIGYKTQTIPINGRSEINVQMEFDVSELDMAEVTAERPIDQGLVKIDERDLTSSATRVDAEMLEEMSALSIDQALQGRMAGVDIVSNSGDPGAGMSIRIRGTSSINGRSEPLIVVDGIPFQTETSNFDFANANQQEYAQLLNVAPSDIESITVLRDAAATALWGTRGSNGVLVITTKRGSKGKPTITYSFRGAVTKQPEQIPMLNGDQYSTLIAEGYMNSFGVPLNINANKEFSYDPRDPYYFHNYSNNTDWINEITQLGHMTDHNIAISGGGEKTRYRVSVNKNGSVGTTKGTGFDRLATRMSLDYLVSKKIKIQTDLAYTNSKTIRNWVDGNSNRDNVRGVAYVKMPNMAVYEHDIFGNQTPNYFSPESNIQGAFSGTYNPLAMAEEATNTTVSNRIIPKFTLQYHIRPDLMFQSDVAFDIINTDQETFLPQVATGLPLNNTNVNRASNTYSDRLITQTFSKLYYTPDLGEDHSLMGLLMFTTYETRGDGFGVTTTNAPSSNLQDPSGISRTDNIGLGSSTDQSRSIGMLANAQYGYLDRYIINASIRRDGSSKFGKNHRFGVFPSISGRWRISGEPFMQDVNWVNELSLRASYGSSGNTPRSNYAHFSTFSSLNWNYLGETGVVPNNLELTNYKWEEVHQTNFGLNLEMFENRVIIGVDVYRKRTKDLFLDNLRIPSTSGFNAVDMNIGTMDNRGFELSVFTTPYQTKDLRVDFDFNVARNENIVQSISDLYQTDNLEGMQSNGNYFVTIQEGNPLGSFYGYKYKGVYTDGEATIARDANGNVITGPNGDVVPMMFNYPITSYEFQAGDAMYEDINHDGNIDYRDIVWLGDANPKLTGGFGPRVTYKNLQVSGYFNFRLGVDIVNSTKMGTENMYSYDNQNAAVLNRWRKPGDETDMPRAMLFRGYNWLGSDRYVEDGSFLRFRTLTVRYNMPEPFLDKANLKDLSFYVTTENLFTWTQYTGQDPEVGLTSSNANRLFQIGYDNARTPPTSTVTLGINARF
ncbi:SusC/RagA family TonB-linked outer membrane protein [Echinicola jeungdonensis]|uniref:SusC/RagA family TonB-linked outer membrane protein n=1 Tax=Echinicola jeungdonensis TaxID=709343 RepID=A0ABV5J4W9_9BACT|nr:SusC/RagA family TonB-linked outer membrane protein [Echinicola jeungdonensis]MDN3669517.1 SusC/RagA family TonB-linked outer membrane protein [Echinicola jeungdonensis]